MQSQLIAYILISFLTGAALVFLLLRGKLGDTRDDLTSAKSQLEHTRNELTIAKTQLIEREEASARERELAKKSELSVVMFPYKEEHGEIGFFSDERRAEIGYKYQIFVAGVPCFDAHKVVVDVLSKKQVTPEKIESAMLSAFDLVGSFAAKHPAFAAFQTAAAATNSVRKAISNSGT